jgi:hypothetical protein
VQVFAGSQITVQDSHNIYRLLMGYLIWPTRVRFVFFFFFFFFGSECHKGMWGMSENSGRVGLWADSGQSVLARWLWCHVLFKLMLSPPILYRRTDEDTHRPLQSVGSSQSKTTSAQLISHINFPSSAVPKTRHPSSEPNGKIPFRKLRA